MDVFKYHMGKVDCLVRDTGHCRRGPESTDQSGIWPNTGTSKTPYEIVLGLVQLSADRPASRPSIDQKKKSNLQILRASLVPCNKCCHKGRKVPNRMHFR